MIKEIKLNRINKDINNYLNSLLQHKYYLKDSKDVCHEEVYYDLNRIGSSCVIMVLHDYKQIWITRKNIPHCELELEVYKEVLLKKFIKCDYKILCR